MLIDAFVGFHVHKDGAYLLSCYGYNICVTLLFLLLSLAKRPPVEETASFLQSLLASHGPNYLEKLFGSKARDALQPLGGVEKVAIALSGTSTKWNFTEKVEVTLHTLLHY
jgi:hypothetical protein